MKSKFTNDISVFLPVRAGSERVKNKNTRPFANYSKGLLELKIKQLLAIKGIKEIVVSTNDIKCLEIALEFQQTNNLIRIDNRPDFLACSNTSLVDLVKYVPKIIKSEHVLWTHVTSPFINTEDYNAAINTYLKALFEGFDSLMSVVRFKNFLWDKDKNDIINRVNNERWPRTQDLKDLYEIDSGIFIAHRNIYINKCDRVGQKPYLFENDKLKAFDIDWEADFKIAEALHQSIK